MFMSLIHIKVSNLQCLIHPLFVVPLCKIHQRRTSELAWGLHFMGAHESCDEISQASGIP
jgi:hypothetical protein